MMSYMDDFYANGVSGHRVHPHNIVLRAPHQPTGLPESRSGKDPDTSRPRDQHIWDLEGIYPRMAGITLLACHTIVDTDQVRRQHWGHESEIFTFYGV